MLISLIIKIFYFNEEFFYLSLNLCIVNGTQSKQNGVQSPISFTSYTIKGKKKKVIFKVRIRMYN